MSILRIGMRISKCGILFTAIMSFVFSTLYVLILVFLPEYVSSIVNLHVMRAAVNFVIALTTFIASFLIHKINKLRLIYLTLIASSAVAVPFLFTSSEILGLAILLFMGMFFAIGLLAFYTWFWDQTMPEERGRVAGFAGFISLPFYFAVIYGLALTLDLVGTITLILFLSIVSTVIVLLQTWKTVPTSRKSEKGNFFEKRTILFYAIPWIVFSLVNATLANNISSSISNLVSPSYHLILVGLQVIGAIFGAVIGGTVADFFGRRLSLAFSLTLYGISTATGGIIQVASIFALAFFVNGLSWGILLALYTFVIWGDLANKANCAKMYSIGLVTYYGSFGIGALLSQEFQISLILSALSSCLLIFLSNIPIILAPELLPPDFRERIMIKLHLRAVRKLSKQAENQG